MNFIHKAKGKTSKHLFKWKLVWWGKCSAETYEELGGGGCLVITFYL